ncbi:hypothetical protein BKA66DRAFT_445460 [Pyrenochaeta sp. MPI-SDFR-AT-0127]|nr:hypothetical protein BKA66DRAFT_445460 [Pyrenochaeta sp. MPI-SDFR-AT-0127]
MRFGKRLSFWLIAATELVAAQSLSPCAQTCVGQTRTRCKSTDYACACLDIKYIFKLTTCIERSCDAAETHDATWYLSSLCNEAGVHLHCLQSSDCHSSSAAEQVQLELRNNYPIEERQIDASFSQRLPTASATIRSTRPASTVASTSTASSVAGPNSSREGGGSGSGGLSTQAKVGIGLGVPIGVLSVVGAIILAFWFGRKSKQEKIAAAAANPQQPVYSGQPHMMAPQGGMSQMQQPEVKPYFSQQGGPAELSQNAQYIGHEMPTKGGNTIEMPASHTPGPYSVPVYGPSPPPGYITPQQAYAQPQPIQPHQQYYPPPQQPATSVPAQTEQVQYPAPGQQWSQPNPGPVELPERKKTPNMYE